MILALSAYDLLVVTFFIISTCIPIIIGLIILITSSVINIIETIHNIKVNNDNNTTNTNKLDNDTNISDDVFNAFSKHDNVR